MKPSAFVLLSVIFMAIPALAAAAPAKPNVIVIMVDDLGSGDVGCLFRNVVYTPNLGRMAKTGVKFTSGYVTAPLCGPSRAGLFTGRYPQRFGFIDNGGGIPAEVKLFPGMLHDAGYRTALIGKWHSKGPMPHDRGCFDETLCSPVSSPFINYHHPKLARNGKVEEFKEYSTDLFAREAGSFIERNKENPFCLTVTFNAPHILRVLENANSIRQQFDVAAASGKTMDVPKVPMSRPGEAALYAAQFPGDAARADTVATIVALDQAVGRILDKLQQTGLDRKTIVFFTGDNGAHPENRSENLPLRDYKWTLYEGGIRVPFFGVYPGVFPAGTEFAHPVSTLDIFATCAALTGAKPPAELEGTDLTPYLNGGKTNPPHEALYFGIKSWGGVYLGAVRQGPWKLILADGHNPELYDLSNDMAEAHNLAANEPGRVKALRGKWQTWNAPMPAPNNKAAKGDAQGKAKAEGPE